MGFDVELVNSSAKKEANVCPHCRRILEDPFQTDEGVRLCKTCLHEIKSKPNGFCTCCRVTVLDGQYYPDRAAQREVNVIMVVCKYKKLGCPWEEKLQGYKAHVESCGFAGVSCPNAGCKEMVLSSQLNTHLAECDYRIVDCSYCHEKMMAKDLDVHHSSECRMYPVECRRCREIVPHRHMMDDHLNHACKLEECLVCNAIVSSSDHRIAE